MDRLTIVVTMDTFYVHKIFCDYTGYTGLHWIHCDCFRSIVLHWIFLITMDILHFMYVRCSLITSDTLDTLWYYSSYCITFISLWLQRIHLMHIRCRMITTDRLGYIVIAFYPLWLHWLHFVYYAIHCGCIGYIGLH